MALDVFDCCYESCISFFMFICIQVSLSIFREKKERINMNHFEISHMTWKTISNTVKHIAPTDSI